MGCDKVSTDQLYEEFKTKAEAVSAEVNRFKKAEEAFKFIQDFIEDYAREEGEEIKTVWSSTPCLGEYREKLKEKPNIFMEKEIPVHAESSSIGVSEMDVAIAETGTLAQDATDILKRLVSSLTFIHIAIVPTKNLIKDTTVYLDKLHENPPGFAAFITGPSRTADIERVLTIGVHGPERLIIVFVDETGGEKNG